MKRTVGFHLSLPRAATQASGRISSGYVRLRYTRDRRWQFVEITADFLLVPARTLVTLPDELPFEQGAAIACGTGTAYMALKKLDVSGRDTRDRTGQLGPEPPLIGRQPPDAMAVYAGHLEPRTTGAERRDNPYLNGQLPLR